MWRKSVLRSFDGFSIRSRDLLLSYLSRTEALVVAVSFPTEDSANAFLLEDEALDTCIGCSAGRKRYDGSARPRSCGKKRVMLTWTDKLSTGSPSRLNGNTAPSLSEFLTSLSISLPVSVPIATVVFSAHPTLVSGTLTSAPRFDQLSRLSVHMSPPSVTIARCEWDGWNAIAVGMDGLDSLASSTVLIGEDALRVSYTITLAGDERGTRNSRFRRVGWS